MTAHDVRSKLHALASPEVAASSARFFKSGPGQYGEDDQFIGVRVPVMRTLARECRALPLAEIAKLLNSAIHEERHLALLILVLSVHRCTADHRKAAFDFYLSHTRHINNWDLVDCSAPAIVGGYLEDKPRSKLSQLAKSASIWERRIAIVATQHFIRLDQFDDTIAISRQLLGDSEDLIHKAAGWMLREVGGRDVTVLIAFLHENGASMPRTMLRYAIEHFSPDERRAWLAKTR